MFVLQKSEEEGSRMFQTDFEKEIQAYYRALYRNLIDRDTEAASGLIDDGFSFTGIEGEEKSKDEFLGDIDSGELVIYSENIERIYIEKDGDVLKVRGRSKINVSQSGARRRIRRIQLDLVLQKTENADGEHDAKWRVLSAKAARY